MRVLIRWLRWSLSFCFFWLCVLCLANLNTSLYLISQAKGQLSVLTHTTSLTAFQKDRVLTEHERKNLLLIEQIKKYSVDSLGYLPTDNFTRIFDQKKTPVLWVITACEPYSFREHTWSFPIVGKVSYKGFFKKELAEKEYNHFVVLGYDVDLRSVSAWSTLGWFNDPILSSMLDRSKAGLCSLLFHELFHATYYAPSSVDLNENLANFIADKATLQFLRNDTAEVSRYCNAIKDEALFNEYMFQKKDFLEQYYPQISSHKNALSLKLKALKNITDSIRYLPFSNKKRYQDRGSDILQFKNAYFVDFQQYDSMQDSLEIVFNKIYKGDLKKLVRDLKLNKINY